MHLILASQSYEFPRGDSLSLCSFRSDEISWGQADEVIIPVGVGSCRAHHIAVAIVEECICRPETISVEL